MSECGNTTKCSHVNCCGTPAPTERAPRRCAWGSGGCQIDHPGGGPSAGDICVATLTTLAPTGPKAMGAIDAWNELSMPCEHSDPQCNECEAHVPCGDCAIAILNAVRQGGAPRCLAPDPHHGGPCAEPVEWTYCGRHKP